MNITILNGRLCTVPQISIVSIWEESIYVCKFVICVGDNMQDVDVQDTAKDYFECISFGSSAKQISENFGKYSKIVITGKFKNFTFEDSNKTAHFTNIFVVEQVEYGDTKSAYEMQKGNSKMIDLSVVAELKKIDTDFQRLCSAGFLCLDENDYYKIATQNI